MYIDRYQYIFDEKKLFFSSALLFIAGIIVLTLLLSRSRITGPRFYNDRYGRKNQDKHKNGLIISAFLVLIAIFFGFGYWHFMQIQRHCGITTGKLVGKYRNRKNNGWTYRYFFIAHQQPFRCARVYADDARPPVMDSCYTVLYDTTNPNNSIMLLDEPQHCN